MGGFRGVSVIVCAAAAWSQTPPPRLIKLASGFTQPTAITAAGDGSGRLFVVEQPGMIRIVRNGAISGTPFLDIRSRVLCCGERGLLGLAFPPGFAAKRYFYVDYTNQAGDITIARYRLGATPDVADPKSEQVLLTVNHRQAVNHNGGQLAFGPDGLLYIGVGDGGGSGDPFGNAQNTGVLLGKLLRIDVEGAASPYGIPPGNPLAGTMGARGEIWAYGLRNPWRFSFDRKTGELYIGDVGQDSYEEVDVQAASSQGGQNYGWNEMEGFHCFKAGCDPSKYTPPVVEYDHSGGKCAVVGGYVYRGLRFPGLAGTYFYSDFCGGATWGMTQQNGKWISNQVLRANFSLSTYGQDDAGELYVADYGNGDLYLLAGGGAGQVGAAVNAASFQPGLSPGALATIFGQGITAVMGIDAAGGGGGTLPGSIEGTSVKVSGMAAPVLAVAYVNGLEQINFQVPYEVAPGQATVTVDSSGVSAAPFHTNIAAYAPGVFTVDGTHAAAQHGADFSLISAAHPASAGETVVLYATGLGPATNQPATGALAPANPVAHLAGTPTVTVGGVNAAVDFAGLTPGTAGVDQLNVRIPNGLGAGEAAVVVNAGGAASPPVKIFLK